jgi:outer membrane protein OmpA-like peptidoglycan-associated protein
MKNYIILYLTIVSVFSFDCYSQKAKLASADKKYENYSYIDAIKTYERVAEKGYKSVDMFQKLGNSYYFNADLEQSAKWYGELFAMTSEVQAVYYFRYSQSLRAIGENNKADEMLKKFSALSGDDSRGDLFLNNVNYLDAIKNNSGRYTVENAGINSKYSDYGTAVTLNKIVFTSARDTGSLGQRKHTWTDQHFTDLYVADLDEEMNPGVVDKFDKTVKSKFHEATPTFTKDGKTMYFTRNNYLEGKKGKNANNVTLIKIYKATLENDQWANIIELPFDSDNYSTAHPALSPDDKTLYFASDMPGTLGQSDLFKVQINEDGTFGIPMNLGSTINTEGRETFPFVNDEDEIYFASDGRPGMGGLDIFVSKINEDGTFNKVENVGSDVNSSKDDFGYWIDTKSRKGFFTSNRDGGQGYDDIYKFLELKKLTCEQELFGKVTDLDTKEALTEAKVSLFDNRFNPIAEVMSDSNGDYSFAVECGKTYNVRAEKVDYTTKEETITTGKANGKTELNIALEKEQCKVAVGDDLGICFGIKMIYFDLDKSNIRKEAAFDLEKILDVLKENPTMTLDIRSHTDSRASFKYNEDLSDRRAKSTISWLIENGVTSDRLTGKGYGETQLVNKCSDDVDCTEAEHQMNRRSEFIITAL